METKSDLIVDDISDGKRRWRDDDDMEKGLETLQRHLHPWTQAPNSRASIIGEKGALASIDASLAQNNKASPASMDTGFAQR